MATDTKLVKPITGLAALPKEKKNAIGLGGLTAVLLVLGAPITLPLAAAGGAGYYFWKGRQKGCMTPERQKIYEAALKDLKDPAKLKVLADSFAKEGCIQQANMLYKRAGLRELPPEVHKARKQVFKAAQKSTNPQGVEAVATAFEGEGATGAAEALRIHAAALRSL